MLRSNRFADILATLIMSCLAILGWMQLHKEHNLQSETMVSVESKSPDLFQARLCRNDYRQTDLNNVNITTLVDCSGFYPMLAKPIAMKSFDRKVEDVFNLKQSSDRRKEMLKANLDNFTVSDRVVFLSETNSLQ